jgi:two-component system phosphate regulon response regulator PhoB
VSTPPTVLVIEDEQTIAQAVAARLRSEGFAVEVATDGEAGVEAHDRLRPDLVVLDLMLPGLDGLEVCRRIQRDHPVPVLVLTARDTEDDLVTGLAAGADDYLTKPFSPGELQARIRALLRRRAPSALDLPVEVGALRLDPGSRRVSHGSGGARVELKFGPTEFRLLHVLMSHPERVHTRSQLLNRVWGDHVFIEERTVDVHVKRLREALAPAGAQGMVETVRGAGYRFVAQPGADGEGAA